MLNKALLKSVMTRYGDTQENLAMALGLSLSRLNAKINERDGAEFTLTEIRTIVERYSISIEEVQDIFFAPAISDLDI